MFILGGVKNVVYIILVVVVFKLIGILGDLYIFVGNGEYFGKEGGCLWELLFEFEYDLC